MAEFREFVGGPLDGEVLMCESRVVHIPKYVPGEWEFGKYVYRLSDDGDMVLVEGS